jgi:hypothetical protein
VSSLELRKDRIERLEGFSGFGGFRGFNGIVLWNVLVGHEVLRASFSLILLRISPQRAISPVPRVPQMDRNLFQHNPCSLP